LPSTLIQDEDEDHDSPDQERIDYDRIERDYDDLKINKKF